MDSAVTPGVSPGPVPLDINKIVGQYLALRDRKEQLEKQHRAQLQPFKELMDKLEVTMLDHMQNSKVQHIATPNGTAYQTTRLSATIKDGAAFRNFVVANGQFQLVDWRANANHVFDYIKDNNAMPPGLNTSAYVHVRFRSPTDKE